MALGGQSMGNWRRLLDNCFSEAILTLRLFPYRIYQRKALSRPLVSVYGETGKDREGCGLGQERHFAQPLLDQRPRHTLHYAHY